MNLKILTGLLTVSMFTVSCGTTNLVQENAPAKITNTEKLSSVIDMSTANGINSGNTMKLKIAYPAFKTKSADGQTSADIAYLLVNLAKNPTDPLATGSLLSNTWQRVNKADFIADDASFDIIVKNVNGGTITPGATWYAAVKSFDANDKELNVINTTLTGASAGQRIAISDNVEYVGLSNNKFYTDNTFTTIETDPTILDVALTIEDIGAAITSKLNVNNGSSALPGIQVIE